MRRWIFTLAKIAVSVALLSYLAYDASRNDVFDDLIRGQKDWWRLALAQALIGVAIILTFVRWHRLAKALELDFGMLDAIRLGCLGYLGNFVSLGSVGGDLFKAVWAAKDRPGKRHEAIASVVVDRIIGLYGVFLLASCAILVSGIWRDAVVEVRVLSRVILVAFAVATIVSVALCASRSLERWLKRSLAKIPWMGASLSRFVEAWGAYRQQPKVLAGAIAITVLAQALMAVAIHQGAAGLPEADRSLTDHMVIVPIAVVASALPLPLNGLGAFEGVIEFLYQRLPGDPPAAGQGFVIALAYRMMTVVLAAVCAGWLWLRPAIPSASLRRESLGRAETAQA